MRALSQHRRSWPRAARLARWGSLLALLAAGAGCAHQPLTYDRRVLTLDFENTIPDPAAANLGATLADMLTANLANHPRIAVVERQGNPALRNVGWQEAGRRASVDYVIVGSVSRLNRNYVVAIRLLSMVTGEVVKGSAVERSCNREEDLYPLIAAMGNVMAHHLSILSEHYEYYVNHQPYGNPSQSGAR